MRNHHPGQLGLNPTGDPLEDWIPFKSGLPQRQGSQIWTYPMSSITSWGLLPGSKLWPLWPALHIGRTSSYSQRDLQGVEGTICGWGVQVIQVMAILLDILLGYLLQKHTHSIFHLNVHHCQPQENLCLASSQVGPDSSLCQFLQPSYILCNNEMSSNEISHVRTQR